MRYDMSSASVDESGGQQRLKSIRPKDFYVSPIRRLRALGLPSSDRQGHSSHEKDTRTCSHMPLARPLLLTDPSLSLNSGHTS